MKARLSFLSALGLVALLPIAGAFAMEVKLNGTVVNSFGGFEDAAVGSNPVATVGDSAVDEFMNLAGYGRVNVFGPDEEGPGARDGDRYVEVIAQGTQAGSVLGIFETAAVPGDQLSAKVSVYHDTSSFAPIETDWSMGMCLAFVRGYEGYHGQHNTWLSFAPKSAYWLADPGRAELVGDAQEGEWALLYNDGAWKNATSGGQKIFMAMDQWIDFQVDLNVGVEYTATLNGIQTDPMAIPEARQADNIVGFHVLPNTGASLIELYVDGPVGGGPEPLAGDLNDDGMVGSADLDIVRGNWGTSVDPGCLSCGDPSGDGSVGSADLDIVRANWGSTAAASAVPEPGALVLVVMGAGFLVLRRKERFMRLLTLFVAAGFVLSVAGTSHALVITNTTTGMVEFDSEGFETSEVGGLPNPAASGNWVLYNHMSTVASAASLVAGPGEGPGPHVGDRYLRVINEPFGDLQQAASKVTGLRWSSADVVAYLATPSLTGEQLVAEFSLYFDPAQFIPQNYWDNVPCFSFSKAGGTFAQRHNWITMTRGGEEWAKAGLFLDETGREEGDMHLAYYNAETGGWQQFTTNFGSELMWISEDAWHDIKIDLVTGIEFTLTLDGVTSDPVLIESSLANNSVTSFQIWNNCSSANAFYVDGYGAAAAVPEPATCAMLLLGGIAVALFRRKTR